MNENAQAKIKALEDVKSLLDSLSKWTHGAYARDKNNDPVLTFSYTAVKWCIAGAIGKVQSKISIYDEIRKTLGIPKPLSLSSYNDDPSTTYEDIISLIDRTIERIKTNEQA